MRGRKKRWVACTQHKCTHMRALPGFSREGGDRSQWVSRVLVFRSRHLAPSGVCLWTSLPPCLSGAPAIPTPLLSAVRASAANFGTCAHRLRRRSADPLPGSPARESVRGHCRMPRAVSRDAFRQLFRDHPPTPSARNPNLRLDPSCHVILDIGDERRRRKKKLPE